MSVKASWNAVIVLHLGASPWEAAEWGLGLFLMCSVDFARRSCLSISRVSAGPQKPQTPPCRSAPRQSERRGSAFIAGHKEPRAFKGV